MGTKLRGAVMLAALATLLISVNASAQVRYVHPDGDDSNFDGTYWNDLGAGVGPWKTLRHALDQLNDPLADPFTEIWVAMGEGGHVYTPDDDDLDVSFFVGKPVAIRGGFVGDEVFATDRTPGNVSVLSGDLPESTDWSLRIMKIAVLEDEEAVELDALKFVGPGLPEGDPVFGGGIETLMPESPLTYEDYGDIRIHDCIFDGLVAGDEGEGALGGGGAILTRYRRVVLRDNLFVHNAARSGGGSSFLEPSGGAVRMTWGELRSARCVFTGNVGAGGGGAIYSEDSPVTVVNCDFRENGVKTTGSATGGAIDHLPALDETDIHPLVVNNCLFAQNRAGSAGGGAIFAWRGASIAESTFHANTTTGWVGGAVCVGNSLETAVLTMSNNIFWANTAAYATSGDLENQYGWDSGYSATLSSTYSCIEATSVPAGTGNINDDPRFVDETAGDLRLRRYSPAINTGDESIRPEDAEDVDDDLSTSELQPKDLDLGERLLGPEVDMGAYEGPPCLADLNGDGTVNGADMGIMLGTWSCSGEDCVADLNGDGVVNGADLGLLLAGWGSCPGGSEEMMMMMMAMSGGETGLTPESLMQLFNVNSIGALVEALMSMDESARNALLSAMEGS